MQRIAGYPDFFCLLFPVYVDTSTNNILGFSILAIRKFISGGAGNGKQLSGYAARRAVGAACTA